MEGKSGSWLLLMMVVMGWCVTLSSASFGDEYYRGSRKTDATSSMGFNRAASSSIVLPVHGNVYPTGYTLNSFNGIIHLPPKIIVFDARSSFG